jgi:Protein of unknown function (DUF2637)
VTGILRVPRRAALVTISALVAAASLVSFSESFRGLFLWAHEHGLSGLWAVTWPLQVDVFIAVGELALFVALADSWPPRSRVAAWGVTVLGLAVSVAGNVGHVAGHSLTDRATAAVPPLAAAAALAVGLGVLKRVVEAHHRSAPGAHPESAPAGITDTGVTIIPSGEGAALRATLPTTNAAPSDHPTPLSSRRQNRSQRVGPDITAGQSVPDVSVSESAPPAWGAPVPALTTAPEAHPGASALNGRAHPKRTRTPSAPVSGTDAESEFMSELAAGTLPSIRQIRARMHLGQDRARQVREHLKGVLVRA